MHKHGLTLTLATAAGVTVSAVVLILRGLGGITGSAAFLLLAVLVIIVPISRSLSRRILLSGTIFLAWVPMLWWVDLGTFADRTGWLLAIGYGALVGWVLGGTSIRKRLVMVVPRFRSVDLIPFAAAIAASWVLAPLLRVASDDRALGLLMKSGWDHVAHFNMVRLIASQGSVLGTLGTTPDGSTWVNTSYPKHFHALVNAVVELANGPVGVAGVPGAGAYGKGVAIIFVAVAILLAAGLAQVPSLSQRPYLAWPLIALPLTAFLVGPGSVAISAGYPNFVLACATAALTACVAIGLPRVVQPVQVLALVGLVMATALGWLLLLPLAAVLAVVAFLPFARERWRATRVRLVTTIAIAIAGFSGIVTAVMTVLPDLNGTTLLLGASEPFPAGYTLAITITCIALAIVILQFSSNRPTGTRLRIGTLGIAPLLALLMLVVLGVRQIQSSNALLYYFGKLASGTLLVSLVIFVILLSFVLPHASHGSWLRGKGIGRVGALSVSVLLTLAALQPFGYVGPTIGGRISGEADGLHYRAAARVVAASDTAEEARLVEASRIASQEPFGLTIYLAALQGDPLLHLANQWHLALSNTWSEKAEKLSSYLDTAAMADAVQSEKLGPQVSRILEDEPSVNVIVAPEVYRTTVDDVPEEFRSRLLTW